MWDRCTQIGCNSSKNYLGKGIKVCERWKSFENFLIDMGKRPKGMTIDRIDNSLNYCPENCRWATTLEQGRNRSNNHRLEFQGETLCLSEWEEKLGLKKGLICCRLSKGWSIEKTLTTPTRKSW
jgi:hypothetical protein